jgi:hypothetical protein
MRIFFELSGYRGRSRRSDGDDPRREAGRRRGRLRGPHRDRLHGGEPLVFYYRDSTIRLDSEAGVTPIHKFAPVEATVEVQDLDDNGYLQQVRILAEDVINQGGVTDLQLVKARIDP